MNTTRIAELRRARGWTQERLAATSAVAVRTIQRLEAGADASLETLSLLADALGVTVSELFESVEDEQFADSVRSLDERTAGQRAARKRIEDGWEYLFNGIGVIISIIATILLVTRVTGWAVLLVPGIYWAGIRMLFESARATWLEPRLDARFPLTAPRLG